VKVAGPDIGAIATDNEMRGTADGDAVTEDYRRPVKVKERKKIVRKDEEETYSVITAARATAAFV
jgi:hypothetical protein